MSLDSELNGWLRWYKLRSSFFFNATHEIISAHGESQHELSLSQRYSKGVIWHGLMDHVKCFRPLLSADKTMEKRNCDLKCSCKDSVEQQTNKQRMNNDFLKQFSLRVLTISRNQMESNLHKKKLVKILPKAINFIHHALPLFLIKPFN